MNERDVILDCLFIGGSTQDVMMRMERVPQADERVQAWDYVKCCGGRFRNGGVRPPKARRQNRNYYCCGKR